jgi:putative PIN family toxin of toxin-antitoxin system
MVRGILSSTGAAAAVVDAAVDERFTLVTSYRLIEELADVLARPRITSKYEIDAQRLASILELLEFSIVVAGVPHVLIVERDPDDDWVIAAAFEADANFIVTEDQDLLDLKEVKGIPVVTAAMFLQGLRAA